MQLPVERPNKHQERSARTREQLLDATIESLLEVGYARTSSTVVAERAGLSRGAPVHQFGTHAELLGQTIEHLTAKQLEALHAATPAGEPVEVVVELVSAVFGGRLGLAAIQMFTGIADDAELRERMLRAQRELTGAALTACAARVELDGARLETLFWLTVNLQRGLSIDELVGRDAGRRALLDAWKQIATGAFG